MPSTCAPNTTNKHLLTPLLGFLAAAILLGLVALLPAQNGLAAAPGSKAVAPASCPPNWNMVPTTNPRTHHYLNAIEVISANDIWAVGEYYDENNYTPDTALTMHWDGTIWNIVPTPPLGKGITLKGVSAVASNDVWAVGLYYPGGAYESIAMHWDGTAWTIVPTPTRPGGTELNAVVALAPNDVWAVGANDGSHSTIAMHWDGTQWSFVSTPNGGGFSDDNVLTSVSAVSPSDIWAVGYIYPKGGTPRTLSLHWNGTQWALVNTPNPGNYSRSLYGVTAIASNDVWAVGQYSYNSGETYLPLFLHWDGTQWNFVPGPDFPDYSLLRAVRAVAPNDIWAVGTNSPGDFGPFETLIMHWDGTAWTRVFSPNGFRDFNRLYGVAAVSSDDVWAVGNSDLDNFPYTSDSLILRHLCPAATATATPTGTRTPPTSTATSTATNTTAPTNTPSVTIVASSTTSATAIASATGATTGTPTPASTQASTTTATFVGNTPTSTAMASATLPTGCTITFSDVPSTDTFYSSISCLACRGIVSGYSDGTFRPNNQVTRGQLAKMVSNSAGFSESITGQTFTDVPPTNTFYVWIERLARRGHMSGYNCGGPGEPCVNNMPYFRPFANATRGQTSKIVANAAGFSETPSGQTFEDVPPTHTFYEFIQRLASRNVMQGYACGRPDEPCVPPDNRPYFRPNNDVTRGQSSKIVANTFFPECQTR